MEYRLAKRDELEKCIALMADAFFPYEFSKIYCAGNETRRYKFTEAVQRTALSIYFKRKTLFVAVEQGEIFACACIDRPGEKSPSLWEQTKNGALKLVSIAGVKETLGYANMFSITERHCYEIKEPHWYLANYGVAPHLQQKGFGCKALVRGLFPYIAKHGGGKLLLVTNSEVNSRFYKKNGFKELHYEELELNGKKTG